MLNFLANIFNPQKTPTVGSSLTAQPAPTSQPITHQISSLSSPSSTGNYQGQFGTNQNYGGSGGYNYAYPQSNSPSPIASQSSSLSGSSSGGYGGYPSVQAFQTAHGLQPDGIVGPLTRAALAGNTSGSNSSGNQMTNVSSSGYSMPYNPSSQGGGNTVVGQGDAGAPQGASTTALTPSTDQSQNNSPSGQNDYQQQVAAVQALGQMSPAEQQAQQSLIDLQNNYQTGQQGIADKQIPMEFITGQQQSLENRFNNAQLPLEQQLGLAQQQRQMALTAAEGSLEAQKPVSLAYGGSLVNPYSGTTVNGGIFGGGSSNSQTSSTGSGINPGTGLGNSPSTAQILGYLAQNGINPSRYDMPGLINAIQGGATAQQIISGQAGLAGAKAGATVRSQTGFNPLTGQQYYYTPTVGSGQNSKTSQSGMSGYTGGSTIANNAQSSGGANSQQIMAVQQALGIKADGIAGPQTKMAVMKFQSANGLPPTGVIDSATLAAGKFGVNPAVANQNSNNQSNAPATLPQPTSYAQKALAQDFTSGRLADTISAQNTAIGHLSAAYDLAHQMNNWSLQPGNVGKNFFNSVIGKAAVDNYKLAHMLSSSELSAAYGNDTGGERQLTAALGSSNTSPAQLKGYAQTSATLLSSKILSNVQQYKTAYGQNSPLNLNWFVRPENQQALAGMGIQLHQSGNDVGAYQQQPDGSYKKI